MVEKENSINISKTQNNYTKWQLDTLNIIKKYEGLHLSAYCDELYYWSDWKYYKNHTACANWGRRSIWYWTKSFAWEVITKEQADKRVLEYLKYTFEKLENTTCYTDMQKTAISDFAYNSWRNTKHNVTGLQFGYYVQTCNKQAIEWFLAPYNYKSTWLKKRRQAQYNFWKWIEKY